MSWRIFLVILAAILLAMPLFLTLLQKGSVVRLYGAAMVLLGIALHVPTAMPISIVLFDVGIGIITISYLWSGETVIRLRWWIFSLSIMLLVVLITLGFAGEIARDCLAMMLQFLSP